MTCRLAGLLCMLACPSAAVTQQDTVPDRPFVRGGVYDKPYLTNLLGRTALGGYAEAHARFARVDGVREERGFEARRFNLFTATEVSDFVRMAAELEIEDGGEEIKLEFAALDLRVHSSFNLRAGMLLSPLGRFNLSHDSPLNEFTDRPVISVEVLGTALSEPGLGVFGLVPVGLRGRVTYELYAVNGFSDGLIRQSPEGTRLPAGRGNLEDNNASPAFVGRVAWSPALNFELGISGHHGAYNEFSADGLDLDERRDVTIIVFDGEASVASFRSTAEVAIASIDIPGVLDGIFASRQHGLYLDVLRDFGFGWLRTLPRSYFSAGLRLDIVDFDTSIDGDDVRQLTAGFNFRPTSDAVVKLDYVRGRSHDRFNNPADHARVQFSFATYF